MLPQLGDAARRVDQVQLAVVATGVRGGERVHHDTGRLAAFERDDQVMRDSGRSRLRRGGDAGRPRRSRHQWSWPRISPPGARLLCTLP